MTFTNADGETVFTEDPIEANASDSDFKAAIKGFYSAQVGSNI